MAGYIISQWGKQSKLLVAYDFVRFGEHIVHSVLVKIYNYRSLKLSVHSLLASPLCNQNCLFLRRVNAKQITIIVMHAHGSAPGSLWSRKVSIDWTHLSIQPASSIRNYRNPAFHPCRPLYTPMRSTQPLAVRRMVNQAYLNLSSMSKAADRPGNAFIVHSHGCEAGPNPNPKQHLSTCIHFHVWCGNTDRYIHVHSI